MGQQQPPFIASGFMGEPPPPPPPAPWWEVLVTLIRHLGEDIRDRFAAAARDAAHRRASRRRWREGDDES